MKNPNVMHLTSTMFSGGAETVAINILNNLESCQFTPFLMTSRSEGPLLAKLSKNIKRTCLQRKFTLDFNGFARFIKFIRGNDIQIIHAHENTIFLALISKLFAPRTIVIWHNHMSGMLKSRRAKPWYLLAGRVADLILVANTDLVDWTINKIGISAEKVRYVSNFIDSKSLQTASSSKEEFLAADETYTKIVCVGNIKPEKDQITLLRAFASVVKRVPNVHLILVGQNTSNTYSTMIDETIRDLGLTNDISVIRECYDVSVILTKCHIGVLSSKNEAFPMALIEYGCAKLPTIATSVGQCSEILDYGRAGVLVEPSKPDQLAAAMIRLLKSPRQMNEFGQALFERVRNLYSSEVVMQEYKDLYNKLLEGRSKND